METKELLKEAVKAEVVKLMAQELLREDSFEKLKSELAAELFELKETEPKETEPKVTVTVTETIIDKPEEKKEDKKVFIRELNKNWGYDPINRQEEKTKELLGFLPNFKNIASGFKGQEISLEEKHFMENSSFTKRRLINELKDKIKDIEKNIHVNTPYTGEEVDEVLIGKTLQSSAEKLREFKETFYGKKSENTIPVSNGLGFSPSQEYVVDHLLSKQKEKLENGYSAYALEQYKDAFEKAALEQHIDIYLPKATSTPDAKIPSLDTPSHILNAKDKFNEVLEVAKKKRTPIKKEVGIVKEPSKKASVKKASAKKKTNKK